MQGEAGRAQVCKLPLCAAELLGEQMVSITANAKSMTTGGRMPPISKLPRIPSPSLEDPIWDPRQSTLPPVDKDSALTASLREVKVNEMDKRKDYQATACFQVPDLLHNSCVTLLELRYLSVPWFLYP